MKFALREETFDFRGTPIRIRELTQADRSKIAKAMTKDSTTGPVMYVTACCVEPAFTEAEVVELPAELVAAIVSKVNTLSGLDREVSEKNG